MEAVYGLCGVDRGIPEVWGSVYDVRELLASSVKADGWKNLRWNWNFRCLLKNVKKKLLKRVDRTAVGKLLRECGMVN